MGKSRLEAFSDGVLAIIITIMVLELKIPNSEDTSLKSLTPMIPVFLSYVMSFIYVGMYWNNHHHLFHATQKINGQVLWANLHLLFWLSLIPVSTHWIGEHYTEVYPVALYGIILLMSAVAYYILVRSLVKIEANQAVLAKMIGGDFKGIISIVLYIAGIALCFVNTWLGIVLYATMVIIWFIPDKRIEKKLSKE